MNCPNCGSEMVFVTYKPLGDGFRPVLYSCPECEYLETRNEPCRPAKAVRTGSRSHSSLPPPVTREFKLGVNVLDNGCFKLTETNPFGEITRLIINTQEEQTRRALMSLGWRPPAKSLKALGIYVGASGHEYRCKSATMPDANYFEPEELEAIAAAERLRREQELTDAPG